MILETTKEDLILAHAEISALSKEVKQDGNLFLSDCDFTRLTYLKRAFMPITELVSKKDFKFIFLGVDKNKGTEYIEKLINMGAKVNLNNPQKEYALINFLGEEIIAELVYENKMSYVGRHPKKRPGFHPGACNPKFARVLVNLTGVSVNESLLDPFCGTGGILLESSDMGIKSTGYDLNKEMIDKCRQNLDYFKSESNIYLKNALDIDSNFDVIATELPFGFTTKLNSSVEDLLLNFCMKASNFCKKMVVAIPSNKKYETPGYELVFEHVVYIHKSLSKKIIILKLKEKKKLI